MTTAAWIAVSFILGVIVGLVLAALMGWPDNPLDDPAGDARERSD